MNRKAEKLFDAITLLREDLVEEAQDYVFRKRRSGWKNFGSLAACMALVASLALLAALPRGCGGAAPMDKADQNNSAAPSSPAEMPSGGGEDPMYGDGSAGGVDTAPSPPSGDPSPGEAPPASEEPRQFTAQVLEVLADSLLVEPLEGEAERRSADRIEVPVGGEAPAFAEGDLVRVTYGGEIQESDPARIVGARSVEKLEGTQ